LPFRNHWYVGELPPLVGVAVKVIDCPVQNGLEDAAILTDTGSDVLTVILTVFEVAGLPEAHGALDVITTYTWAPLAGETLV
jgi:hypothetical protein